MIFEFDELSFERRECESVKVSEVGEGERDGLRRKKLNENNVLKMSLGIVCVCVCERERDREREREDK